MLGSVAVAVSLVVAPATATATDPALLAASRAPLERVSAASSALAAARSDPDAAQALYNAAREFQGLIARAQPVSRGCEPLTRASDALARTQLRAAEGVDRLSAAQTGAALARVARLMRSLAAARDGCAASDGPPARVTQPPPLQAPKPGEVWFAPELRVRVPEAALTAEIYDETRRLESVPVAGGGLLRRKLPLTPGLHTPGVVFRDGDGRSISAAQSANVQLLPAGASRATAPIRRDPALDRAATRAAATFPGYAAVWIHDLDSGRYGGVDETARYPAASLTKLGVLAAALRLARAPERSPLIYDLQALSGWSSNLATNRLLAILGHGSPERGAAVAQRALRALGAQVSTFTGPYRVGTGLLAPGAEPPLVSARIATARDLGLVLARLQQAARGRSDALRTSGLTIGQARVALALLLRSEARVENLGLLRPSLRAVSIAQKHGWLNDAHHTAAIVYSRRGPWVISILTYAPGSTRAAAAAIGASLADQLRLR